jgi:hypothetical protein
MIYLKELTESENENENEEEEKEPKKQYLSSVKLMQIVTYVFRMVANQGESKAMILS